MLKGGGGGYPFKNNLLHSKCLDWIHFFSEYRSPTVCFPCKSRAYCLFFHHVKKSFWYIKKKRCLLNTNLLILLLFMKKEIKTCQQSIIMMQSAIEVIMSCTYFRLDIYIIYQMDRNLQIDPLCVRKFIRNAL